MASAVAAGGAGQCRQPARLTCAANRQLFNAQRRLAHADRHALPILAADAHARIQLHVIADHGDAIEHVRAIADLPPLQEIQGKILGLLQAPAQKLAALINTPGTQVARVIGAYSEKSA